jgi:hypothetical protein
VHRHLVAGEIVIERKPYSWRLPTARYVGVSISSFIRSSRLVPPATNFAPGVRAAAAAASAGVRALS